MQNLEFQFNPEELNALIQHNPNHKLLASLYVFEHYQNKGRELYIGLQSADNDTNIPDTTVDVVRACPNPPGWGATIKFVPHSNLVNCPKFVIGKVEKTQLVSLGTDKVVTVSIEGSIVKNALNEDNLLLNAVFRVKQADTIITTVKAVIL